ncbi:MAG TPA: lactonase family protein [Gemmataceae bacterium]|nr:lactonase family protein [Gemmataceae bacterium]
MTAECVLFRYSSALAVIALFAPLFFLSVAARAPADQARPEKMWVFVGTYTGKASKGIYRCELDLATGKLSDPVVAAEVVSPSFLAIHPNHRFLYAVTETSDFGGKKAGAVSAYALDPKSGELRLLNIQSSGGAGPCHLVVDHKGKDVLVANYGGGSAGVLPIKDDGSLEALSSFIQHRGSSVNRQRQEGPHAHSINVSQDNRFAFVADLGLDKVLIYRFDASAGTLTANDPPAARVTPGSGPRHFALHPNGKWAWVINEMANTVTRFDYDAERGALQPRESVSSLPKGFTGTSYTAEVQAHPSGKFLYGSNRGHDSIAVFAIDQDTGTVTPVAHQAEGIKVPRNFGIDPTGAYLIVANQDGDSLIVFRINGDTGALTPAGSTVKVPMPVCVKMVPRE